MRRGFYLALGWLALIVGFVGMVLPLLPTVVFWIIAAACFSRSNPRVERWLLEHRTVGPHILAWRQRGAISRRGQIAATIALAASGAVGFLTLSGALAFLPATICAAAAGFIWTRPD